MLHLWNQHTQFFAFSFSRLCAVKTYITWLYFILLILQENFHLIKFQTLRLVFFILVDHCFWVFLTSLFFSCLFLCSAKGNRYHQVVGAGTGSVLQSWTAWQAKIWEQDLLGVLATFCSEGTQGVPNDHWQVWSSRMFTSCGWVWETFCS